MRSLVIKAALAFLPMLLVTPSLGQPAPAAPAPPDVCQQLAAFLQERGGRIDKPLSTPITLDEVNRYMSSKNVRACREAISIMQTSGVDVPGPLRDAIGSPSPSSQNAGTRK